MQKVNDESNLYIKKSIELESLLRDHFNHRQQSKKTLKDRLRTTEIEADQLRQTVAALSEELKAEQSRCHSLFNALEELKRSQNADFVHRERQIYEKERNVEACAQALALKNDECELRLKSLNQQDEDVRIREELLRVNQASFEAGIAPAQKQAESERLRCNRMREQAEVFLEEAQRSAAAARLRKYELESFYHVETLSFALQRKETEQRFYIMNQEATELLRLVSLRNAHVIVVEDKSIRRISARENELVSKIELLELKEKEAISRQQRDHARVIEERERVSSMRESMRHECGMILEKVRSLATEGSSDAEQSQVDKLRDLEKLLAL